MARYIITGNYSTDGIRGMLASPSDREAAVKPLVEASGGKMESYHVTLGDSDFCMHVSVESADMEGLMAALIVAGASGGVSNLKTVQAFTSHEFMAAQKRAGAMVAKFKAPNAS